VEAACWALPLSLTTWPLAGSQAFFRPPLWRLLSVLIGDSEDNVVEVPYSGSAKNLESPTRPVTCLLGTGLDTIFTGNQSLEPEPGTTVQDKRGIYFVNAFITHVLNALRSTFPQKK
jgi:hypothetical protein